MAQQPDETIMDMFTTFGRELKLPKVDADAILEHHRKNLEAVQKAMSAGASGARSVMEKQRDLLQKQFRDMSEAAQDFRLPGTPQEALSRQAELMRKLFEAAVGNVSESAQIIQKSGGESVEILRERISQSMEEVRHGYETGR